MLNLNAYLFFNGNCTEAMEFYKQALGGELTLIKVGDSPMGEQMPDKKDQIMHSVLVSGNMSLMASDMLMGEGVVHGTSIAICISGGTLAELEPVFNKLAEGAKSTTPLKEEFFGTFGDLVDKYGIRWMFEADKPKE